MLFAGILNASATPYRILSQNLLRRSGPSRHAGNRAMRITSLSTASQLPLENEAVNNFTIVEDQQYNCLPVRYVPCI